MDVEDGTGRLGELSAGRRSCRDRHLPEWHDIYDGNDTKAARQTLPKELWSIARRKLDMIDAARSLHDLKAPPSNELEKLKRKLAGKYSIRINKQWRVIFEFADGTASNVSVGDPH